MNTTTADPQDPSDPGLSPIEYHGETARRSKIAAILLTGLHPALGYLYVGKTGAAVMAATALGLYVAIFMVVWGALQFFPLLPLFVAIAGWIVLASLCLMDVLREVDRLGEGYVLKGFNHAVIYALVLVFVGVLPGAVAWQAATGVLWGVVKINDNTMYPTLAPGDTLLVDRLVFKRRAPRRGDKVVVKTSDSGNPSRVLLSRIVGLPGDRVILDDSDVAINGTRLARFTYGDEGDLSEGALAGAPVPGNARPYVEDNDGARYLIAGDVTPHSDEPSEPVVVGKDEILLLSDNRGMIGPEPFVTVSPDQIIGQPRFILFSEAPPQEASSRTRWERIGLRVD